MIRNYFKIAIRGILNDKFYSMINILGLTIGITCSFLLLLYIKDELSYDKYHSKASQIYRVVSHVKEPDKEMNLAITQPPLGPTLKKDYPVIENYVRFFPYPKTLFKVGDKRFFQENIYSADSTVFNVFSFQFIKGDPKTALNAPNSIVLTKSMAQRLLGSTDVVGEMLTTNNATNTTYKVTGVVEDVPKNSHLILNGLFSLSKEERQTGSWGGFQNYTYILLPSAYNPLDMEKKLPQLYEKYIKEIFGKMRIKVDYKLQPIKDIHLSSNIEFEPSPTGNMGYIYTFSAVAVFMLLIAAINYMKLATARSVRRAKEVGIRKVVGSFRSALIIQFLTESVIMTLLAVVVSFGLAGILLSFFNEVSGKSISFLNLLHPTFILIALGTAIITGLIGGSYPAFYLSSFRPVAVLKGSLSTKSGNPLLRKSLVVLQFGISMTMLICTMIVYRQLNYMRNKDLGYNQAQVLTIDYQNFQPKDKYRTFKNLLEGNPKIRAVSSATSATSNIQGRRIFTIESNEGMKEKGFLPLFIDADYMKAMGMKIIAGRDFSDKIPADTALGMIVNEATVERMGWKEPIGKKIQLQQGVPQPGNQPPPMAKVVGVIKNFHQASLYNPIEPIIILYKPNNPVIHIKVDPRNVKETVRFIETKWNSIYPDKLFEYKFLDEDFDSAYKADELRGRIFTAFSSMTIFIACLGLFGLVTFTVLQRAKEISVRKVLGASARSITVLLSKEFLGLVVIAILLAFPAAYFVMNKWLEDFAFRIDINNNWWIFIVAVVAATLIAFITVSFQAIRAALANPVKSLRSE